MLAAPAIIKRILIDPLLEALGTELHLGIIRKTAAELGTDYPVRPIQRQPLEDSFFQGLIDLPPVSAPSLG